ncbi:hypothetical protein TELCIR_09761 [Teladorsagia circumcincta]|uniref:Uncharacterized protein n=1 Tax=Teladorsagia circumcincta TaxID=45464 RepID=A0A2G9UDX9_TELCI|nr:hypothetical protein TELCIR_09761 [Teladorsagia circumcincta]
MKDIILYRGGTMPGWKSLRRLIPLLNT